MKRPETVGTTVYCKRCSSEMHSAHASASIHAIRVLVNRDLSNAIGEPAWLSGPLCEACLAAWSAMIHRRQPGPLKKWAEYFKEAQDEHDR